MRRPLRRRVDPRPDETAASLASRLAARNGTALRGFCSDMQLSLFAVHDGRSPAVRQVAELAGHDPDAFAATMLTRLGDAASREWSYRGQLLKTENLHRSCRRACPMCLAEDIAGGDMRPAESACARASWRIRHLRTCAVHGVALVEADEPVERHCAYDTTLVYPGLIARLPDACRDAVRRDASPFEAYLSRRLGSGTGGVAWLDAKPMWAMAELVERVGTAELFGRSPNLKRLTEDERWRAGGIGFALLEGGPDGMMRVLDKLHDTFDFARMGRNTPAKIYGHLWHWMDVYATGPGFDDVRDVVREHALSRLPLAAGTELLGRTLETRRIHSLRSLHIETGRHQRRLREVLASHGLLPEGHMTMIPNRIIFDARLVAHIQPPMKTQEVVALLGVARVQPLVREGILTPILASPRQAARHEFSRAEVEGLVTGLLRQAEPLEAVGPDQVDLVDAPRVAAHKLADLMALIREGRFGQVWRLKEAVGLRSVVVSRAEVRALRPKPQPDALSRRQVIKRLRVYHVAVQRLIDGGVIPVREVPTTRGGYPTYWVTEADVTAFQRRYVTLSEMARERRICIRDVKKELNARGIEPVLSPEKYETAFYLRSDI